MNKKMVFVLVSTLMLVLMPMSGASAQGGDPVVRTVPNPSQEDKDWPITRVEIRQVKDPKTGEVHVHNTITRVAPAGAVSAPQGSPCPDSSTTPSADSCYYQGAVSQTDQDAHLGGVVSNLVHYAYRYCSGTDCAIYAPYKLEVWWTRTNSDWDAGSATTRWGCYGCILKCDAGNQYWYVFTYGPFNPTWFGNSTSVTQILYQFSRLKDYGVGVINGNTDSSGYHWGSFEGGMYVDAPY